MLPSRMRRCSIDLDELIKQKKKDLEEEMIEQRVPNPKISETKVTSIFAEELKKNKILTKRRKDLL